MRGLFAILLISICSHPVFALEGGYVGGGLGFSDVTLDDYDGSASANVRVGMVFTPHLTLGFGLSSYNEEHSKAKIGIVPLLIEFNYHILSTVSGPYVGVSGGIAVETVTIEDFYTNGDDYTRTESEGTFGGQAGYNFALADRHSLGGELRYLHVDGDPKKYGFYGLSLMYNFWW